MCTAAQWDRGVFAAVYYLPLLASFPNRSSFGALLQNYQSASARPQITILMSALLVAILSGLWLFCGWNCPQPPCPLTTRSHHHHLGSFPVKEWFSCQGIRGNAKSLYFSRVDVSDQHSVFGSYLRMIFTFWFRVWSLWWEVVVVQGRTRLLTLNHKWPRSRRFCSHTWLCSKSSEWDSDDVQCAMGFKMYWEDANHKGSQQQIYVLGTWWAEWVWLH